MHIRVGARFKEDIIQAFYDGNKHKPETTFGNVNADVLATRKLALHPRQFLQRDPRLRVARVNSPSPPSKIPAPRLSEASVQQNLPARWRSLHIQSPPCQKLRSHHVQNDSDSPRNRRTGAGTTKHMTAGRRGPALLQILAAREVAHFDREVIRSGACTPKAGSPRTFT